MGPYNPKQPIPVIKQLTDTGKLTIAWDRKMKKPPNPKEITTSKVVLTDENEADKIEKDGRFQIDKDKGRSLRKTREWFETEKDFLQYLLVLDALDVELIYSDEE